ncbi:MAG: hypothetical protein V1824_00995, partial [archaeon]
LEIDFNSAFNETDTQAFGDTRTKVFKCNLEKECNDLNYNLDYNSDTKIGDFTIELGVNATELIPINLYIYFSSNDITNVTYDINKSSFQKTIIQNTAQIQDRNLSIVNNNFQIYNYNLADYNLTYLFDIFDNYSYAHADCNLSFSDQKITIRDCDKNSLIKIRYKENRLENISIDYPQINIVKEDVSIVTEDKFNEISDSNNYYIEIEDNYTDLNKGSNKAFSQNIFSKFVKYLDNFGKTKIVKLKIKN